ncbi:hypothetical protein [Streptococcus oriscaviae]|uniref:Uncharacterized protein n=1 Tax=Streptococcus oriscaviae TaxID=2781599 RepID=A0ABX7YMC9_9STRE|nr:hypothetical protein [Streptococcus oriscaviae]QUE54986.1 hypothetical protein INT76_03640 [Streptococcus oriscaviae]
MQISIIDIINLLLSLGTAIFSIYVFQREQREKRFQTDIIIRAVVPTERQSAEVTGVTYVEMMLVNRSTLPTAIIDIELKIIPPRSHPKDLIIGKVLKGPNKITLGGFNHGQQDEPQLSDTFPVSIPPLESRNVVLAFQTEWIRSIKSIEDLRLKATFIDRGKSKQISIASEELKEKLITMRDWLWLTKL